MKKISSMVAIVITVLCIFSVIETSVSTGTTPFVWSTPVQLTSDPANDGSVSIYQDSSGKIWVLFTSDRSGAPQIWYIASTDQGATWSSPQLFPPAQVPSGAHYLAQAYLFEDSKGRLWAAWGRWTGSSQEDIYFATSDDLGATWSDSRLLVSYPDVDGTPCFVEVGTEVWLVFSSWGISYNWNIYCIKTSDGGSTWTSPQGIVISPFRHDWVNVLKDSTGKIWVVYNNTTSPYDPHTSNTWYVTTSDGGSTWSEQRQITSFPSEEMCQTIIEYQCSFYAFYFDRYYPDVCYVASHDSGTTWSNTPERIPDPTIDQHYLDACVIGNSIWVVWMSREAGSWDIWVSKTVCVFVPASIDIDPNTLNLKSKGEWITGYIELPEGYNVVNINASSIMLNGTIPVDSSAPKAIGDYDSDGIPDLMVKFDRAAVSGLILSQGITSGNVVLTITGRLYDGTMLQGSDTIRVMLPMPKSYRPFPI